MGEGAVASWLREAPETPVGFLEVPLILKKWVL
jgi:hypothetical protein